MRSIWLCIDCHVSPEAVKLPYQARVILECLRRSEFGGIKGAPHAPSTSESGQARRSRQPSTQKRKYPCALVEMLPEGLEVCCGNQSHCCWNNMSGSSDFADNKVFVFSARRYPKLEDIKRGCPQRARAFYMCLYS
jgi:hypothetical protein